MTCLVKKKTVKEEEIEYEDISEQKPAAQKGDQIYSQMGLTQLEEVAEGFEAVINNNVAGVPVVSKRPLTPFTTALKALRASQKAAVGTSWNNCTVNVHVYNRDKDGEE